MDNLIQYWITVDGEEVGEIDLPQLTQYARNEVRQSIANFLKVPRHYIKLQRKAGTNTIMGRLYE